MKKLLSLCVTTLNNTNNTDISVLSQLTTDL